MNDTHNQENALSPVLITLLKRVIYRDVDEKIWGPLLNLQSSIRDYANILGLELVLDEVEGYAFFRSRETGAAEETQTELPCLINRRPLSFAVSLLLALLRKKLAEFDKGGAETRLVLSREDIVELMRVFLPDSSNEARLMDQIETHINKVVELGFLRRLKTATADHYEVRRILKAFVDAQWLDDLDQKLAAYQAQLARGLDE